MQRVVYLLLVIMSSLGAYVPNTIAASGALVMQSNESAVFTGHESVVEVGEYIRHVVLLKGTLRFSGEAEEIVVLSGKLILRSGAKVNKSLVIMGGSMVQEDGAQIMPESVDIKAPEGWYRLLMLAFPLFALLLISRNTLRLGAGDESVGLLGGGT